MIAEMSRRRGKEKERDRGREGERENKRRWMTTRGKGKSEKGRNPGRNVIVEKTNKRALRDSEGIEREGGNNSGSLLEHQFPGLIHSLAIAFGVTWTAIMFREYLEYDTVLVRGLLSVFYFTGGTRAQTRREMERRRRRRRRV